MNALAGAPALTIHRSRKLIPEFNLHRPGSPAEAVEMKAACGAGAVFMAGGIDVVNRMKFGVPVSDVIHLAGISGLDGIAEEADGIRLGSLVTHDRLATSPLVARHLPALARTWSDVANIRVRCKGTIGGNIMVGDPGYDFALAAMAADAHLNFLGFDGNFRDVPAADRGAYPADGLLVGITLPRAGALRLGVDRSLRPIVTVALGLDVAGGRITGGRAAIGCAYAKPITARLLLDEPLSPSDLAGQAAALARRIAAELPGPLHDHVAGSGYRRRMIEVLLRRNLAAVT